MTVARPIDWCCLRWESRVTSWRWWLRTGLLVAGAAAAAGERGVQVNVDADGCDIAGDAANEVSLVADPRDPNILAAGWRQFTDRDVSNREAGYAFSRDGGRTWTFPGVLEHFPDIYAPFMASDPALAASGDGDFYYASLVWDTADLDRGVMLSRSRDGGRHWLFLSTVGAYTDNMMPDKEWLVVDTTGGPNDGTIYVTYTNGEHAPNFVYLRRSTDGGATFEDAVQVTRFPGEHTAMPVIATDGTVFLVTLNINPANGFLNVRRSINAERPHTPLRFGRPTKLHSAAVMGGWGQIPVGLHVPTIAADCSDSRYRGAVYVAYTRAGWMGVTNIAVARTHDSGETWEVTPAINRRGFLKKRDCFMPTLSVAPDGRVDVTWFDRRDDPDNLFVAVYYSYSLDGGETWQPNVRLTDSFDPTTGYPALSHKIGEYNAAHSTTERLRLVYTGTYDGDQNLYCLRYAPYLGDLNGDRVVNRRDLDAFALALVDRGAHAQQYAGVDAVQRGDMNTDGRLDEADVSPFLDRILARDPSAN